MNLLDLFDLLENIIIRVLLLLLIILAIRLWKKITFKDIILYNSPSNVLTRLDSYNKIQKSFWLLGAMSFTYLFILVNWRLYIIDLFYGYGYSNDAWLNEYILFVGIFSFFAVRIYRDKKLKNDD